MSLLFTFAVHLAYILHIPYFLLTLHLELWQTSSIIARCFAVATILVAVFLSGSMLLLLWKKILSEAVYAFTHRLHTRRCKGLETRRCIQERCRVQVVDMQYAYKQVYPPSFQDHHSCITFASLASTHNSTTAVKCDVPCHHQFSITSLPILTLLPRPPPACRSQSSLSSPRTSRRSPSHSISRGTRPCYFP